MGVATELRGVFSILPDEEMREAIDQTLASLGPESIRRTEFAWADLSPTGTYLRGGLSNALGEATKIFNSPSDHPDLSRIMSAASLDCRPGVIAPAPEDDRFIWFLPQMQVEADDRPEQFVKGICVTFSVFETIVDMFNADAGLTAAERRVVFQVIMGLRARDAAALDGVGLETKRTQIKSATNKLASGGQTELVRTLIGQLFHLVSASDSVAIQGRIAEEFVARQMPQDCRVMTLRLRTGRYLRLLEAGSPMGKPVVVMHGMMLPVILMGLGSVLSETGLRMLVPIKNGYLDAQNSYALAHASGTAEQFEEDVLDFVEDMFPGPVPLVGTSLGGIAAVRLASARPSLFSQLQLVGLHMPDRTGEIGGGLSNRFHEAIRALSSYPGMLRLLTWQFRKHFANAHTVKWSLQRVFEASPADVNYLLGKTTGRAIHTWYPEFYRNSILGVAEDFRISMTNWRDGLASLPMPATLIHGVDDGLTTMSEIDRLVAKNRNLNLISVEGAGHLLFATHARQTWHEIVAGSD